MKKSIVLFPFLLIVCFCNGQILHQKESKSDYFNLLNANKNQTLIWQDLAGFNFSKMNPSTLNTTVHADGVMINEKKYFLQIKQPDLSTINPMPQAPIDTTTHYHIQIIGEVKEKK